MGPTRGSGGWRRRHPMPGRDRRLPGISLRLPKASVQSPRGQKDLAGLRALRVMQRAQGGHAQASTKLHDVFENSQNIADERGQVGVSDEVIVTAMLLAGASDL